MNEDTKIMIRVNGVPFNMNKNKQNGHNHRIPTYNIKGYKGNIWWSRFLCDTNSETRISYARELEFINLEEFIDNMQSISKTVPTPKFIFDLKYKIIINDEDGKTNEYLGNCLFSTHSSMKYEIDENSPLILTIKDWNLSEVDKNMEFIIVSNADIELASKTLKISKEDARNNLKHLQDCNAVRIWNPIRGGGQIIIAEDGTFLVEGSAISPEQHLDNFMNGKRSKPTTDMVEQLKESLKDKPKEERDRIISELIAKIDNKIAEIDNKAN